MHYYKFDCAKMDDDTLKERIQSHIDCGWMFEGFLDFPPPHQWACLVWDKDSEPIHPSIEPKQT